MTCFSSFILFTRGEMNQQRNYNRIIIWGACTAYLLVVTVLMAYGYAKYEIFGASIVFFLSIAALQPFKIAYEWYARHGNYELKHAVRVTNC